MITAGRALALMQSMLIGGCAFFGRELKTFEFAGVQVHVLNPQPGESLVWHIQYHHTSALLVGDSHQRVEEIMEGESPGANLLKIGHHGSTT